MHPKDAGMEALKRIKANTIEKRLLDPKGNGNPKFGLNFYVVNKAGEFAGVSMYESDLRRVHGERSRDAQDRVAHRRGASLNGRR